jgi:8-oxo-dGTP pyrophosphatase MutT (NUDIX family)
MRHDGKIALVWQNGNSWSFPKGGIDPHETPLEAAWREIKEETGLGAEDLQFVKELGTLVRYSIGKDGTGEDTSRPPSTRTLYLFTTDKIEMKPQDKEVTEAKFVTIDEALKLLTHPKDRDFLESIRDIL